MAERIGILGGGRMARMLVQAAISLGIETTVLTQHAADPAALVARNVVIGDWRTEVALNAFAAQVDVVMLENEFVGAHTLERLAERHLRLVPTAATLALIEDKVQQKHILADAGLAVNPVRPIESPAELLAAGERWGWPVMLKTRTMPYGGHGTARVNGFDECVSACQSLGWPGNPLCAEPWLAFASELATQVIRSVSGEERVYPVVETVQAGGVCRLVRAPAPLPGPVLAEAQRLALAAATAVGALGILAVEMFLTSAGEIIINELAARPHNSGHYTIEGCHCSQFENAVRAALGWPLGNASLCTPAAAMVNVLAPGARPLDATLIAPGLAVDGARVHWYDVRTAWPGRKVGHVTATGADPAAVEALAQRAVAAIEEGMQPGGGR